MLKLKFWREEEAVEEVAKKREAPMIGDSMPEAKVEVAVEVPTNAPAVKGLYVRALFKVTDEPKATAPPPESPEPAVTVTEELTKLLLVITPEEPIEIPPESESEVPWPLVKEKFWREEVAVEEVAMR